MMSKSSLSTLMSPCHLYTDSMPAPRGHGVDCQTQNMRACQSVDARPHSHRSERDPDKETGHSLAKSLVESQLAACEAMADLGDMGWSDHALEFWIMAHRAFDAYVGLAGEGVGAIAAQARQVEPGGRCASGDLSMQVLPAGNHLRWTF